jgi:hypothetical protein
MRLRLLPWLLLLVPIAAATPAWSVSATDPESDATAAPMGGQHAVSCPATDLVAGSVTYDGSDYIWSFTVKDVLAGCAPCVWHFRVAPGWATCAPWTDPEGLAFPATAGYLHFALFEKDGPVIDSASFSQAGLLEVRDATYPFSSTHGVGYFQGNTGTVVLPGYLFDLDETTMFHMSAFVDNTVSPQGCIPSPLGIGCVYSYRDEMET